MTATDPIPSFIAGRDNERTRRGWRSRTIAAALTMTAATLVGCGSGEQGDTSAQPVAPPTAEQTVTPPIEDPEVPEPVPLELPSEAELVEQFTVDLPSDADPSDVLAA